MEDVEDVPWPEPPTARCIVINSDEKSASEANGASTLVPHVSLLYIFAGQHRKSDIGDQLQNLKIAGLITLQILEVDLLRSTDHDVTSDSYWGSLLAKIHAGVFQVIICTPPCNTHSRARNSNVQGPPPIRSKSFPAGFPWLAGKHRQAALLANSFIDKMFEVCHLAHSVGSAFLAEHPEDLGKCTDGSTPASIWSLDEMRTLQQTTKAKTRAFHQCHWGAESSKPTRAIGTLDMEDPDGRNVLFSAWPSFDVQGLYTGPLPRVCGHSRHKPIIRTNSGQGTFRTAAAAAYPPAMCTWIVNMVIRFCSLPKEGVVLPQAAEAVQEKLEPQTSTENVDTSARAGEDAPAMIVDTTAVVDLSSDEDEDGIKKPRIEDHLGGFGPPMMACWSGKSRPMHDGGGLCSPGRWLPRHRKKCSWGCTEAVLASLLSLLRENLSDIPKICVGLACGHASVSPFSEVLLEKGRQVLAVAVSPSSAFSCSELLTVQKNQPFYLRLIGELLRLQGDPDWRVFYKSPSENFWDGVSVGPGRKMPRTPSVFERKIKQRKYDDTFLNTDVANYKSAAGPHMSAVLEKQFQEEALLGFMYKTKLDLVKAEFKDVRIAAQGALEKGDDTWRVLHDASHHVMINHETKIRDQVRMPSAGDARIVMQESAAHDLGPHFSLQFDVSKAHRRYLHRKEDHGLLCCRSDEVEEDVWVNVVGTFGFVCASYWWARLSAGICRLVLRFFHRQWVMQLLFADDARLQTNGPLKFENLILAIFIWCLVGTPLSWAKTKGGMSCEWVGYWLDYARFQLGISESRSAWLIRWGDRVVSDGLVQMRDFAEGLGRLGFTAGVLEFYKPFLAPLYSWSAAAPRDAVLKVPPMVRLTLSWIVSELKTGRRYSLCKKPSEQLGVLFKTDSKGESNYCVLGGFEYNPARSLKDSRWYSVRLTPETAPWIFEKGHASRTIAATELMATLLAVHYFVPVPDVPALPSTGVVCCQGVTDNQTNSYVVAKLMTTAFPLAAILMQLTCMLSQRNLWLNLQWVPRTENVEADALTNGDFSLFSLANRVEVVMDDLPLDVMRSLVERGTAFVQELDALKAHNKTTGRIRSRLRKRARTEWAAEL